MHNQPGGPIFGPMLEEIERRFFTRTPVLNPSGSVREQIINCRHCALEIRYDDNNHEQAEGASALFHKHLLVSHADLLKAQDPLTIDKL